MDEADAAQTREERARDLALEDVLVAARAPGGRTHCLDCGRRIPDERRAVQPNAKRCVPCQEDYE